VWAVTATPTIGRTSAEVQAVNSPIISGLIGSIIAVILCKYISQRVRFRASQGNLRFGWPVFALGCLCLFISFFAGAAFFFDANVWESTSDFLSVIALIAFFGSGAVYTFGEAFMVKGSFDKDQISFHTPWTGTKSEKWRDLLSVQFNGRANWYVLSFNSGSKIRLSTLLAGHGNVLQLLTAKGFDVPE
jgi:hypothetical protein